MTGVRSATIEAPAKVNLFLRVLGRRPDGYHDLETLFQSIELADHVRVSLDPGAPAAVSLDLVGPDLGPPDENLAVRAARGFLDEFDASAAVHVELHKHIPAGGGLGGGSSDAAAVLRLLAALSWPEDSRGEGPEGAPRAVNERLHAVAASLGSDVPFFLRATPLALGRGRGEVLIDLPALPRRHLVVALPPVHVSTPEAFRALARGRQAEGAVDRGGAPVGPPPHGGIRAEGGADGRIPDWDAVESDARNDFETVVVPSHEAIGASMDAMRQAGASTVLLSGSGAASFGLFGAAGEAREAAESLTSRMGWSFLATATRTEVPEPVVS